MERTGAAQPRTTGQPRTAVVWAVLRQELARHGEQKLNIVDLGGGTGGFAVPLAQAGHAVTVVDPSPDALAALLRRAADAQVADRIQAVQGDADSLSQLIGADSADLMLCHAVLEVVDDPGSVAAALARSLRPGGAASVLVANRAAAVLSKAVAGQWQVAMQLLADPQAGVHDSLRRRFDLESLADVLTRAGLAVEQSHGVRVVADLVPGMVADADPEALLAFELAASDRPPYRDLATQLHVLARRAR